MLPSGCCCETIQRGVGPDERVSHGESATPESRQQGDSTSYPAAVMARIAREVEFGVGSAQNDCHAPSAFCWIGGEELERLRDRRIVLRDPHLRSALDREAGRVDVGVGRLVASYADEVPAACCLLSMYVTRRRRHRTGQRAALAERRCTACRLNVEVAVATAPIRSRSTGCRSSAVERRRVDPSGPRTSTRYLAACPGVVAAAATRCRGRQRARRPAGSGPRLLLPRPPTCPTTCPSAPTRRWRARRRCVSNWEVGVVVPRTAAGRGCCWSFCGGDRGQVGDRLRRPRDRVARRPQ